MNNILSSFFEPAKYISPLCFARYEVISSRQSRNDNKGGICADELLRPEASHLYDR